MNSIFDEYINNYDNYNNGKVNFECSVGVLTFIKKRNNINTIIIFEIFINEEYRNMGYCKKFLDYVIKKNHNILIISVLSKILYEYLDRHSSFILVKDGFLHKI
jgi:hypothetical protein